MSGVTSGTPRVPRPGTPPARKKDRMAGDKMQTGGTADTGSQQQGFLSGGGAFNPETDRQVTPDTTRPPIGDTRRRPDMRGPREERPVDRPIPYTPDRQAGPIRGRGGPTRLDRPDGRGPRVPTERPEESSAPEESTPADRRKNTCSWRSKKRSSSCR